MVTVSGFTFAMGMLRDPNYQQNTQHEENNYDTSNIPKNAIHSHEA
jgi:hypothetical protein